MIDTFSSYLLGKFMDKIPIFLLRRILPLESIKNKINLDLWRRYPMRVSLSGSVPSIDIWFSITNLNPVDIQLDRLIVDLSLGQPLAYAFLVSRHNIPKFSTLNEIQLSMRGLSTAQIKWIESHSNASRSTDPFTLYIEAYFVTKIGWIKIKTDLQQQAVEVH